MDKKMDNEDPDFIAEKWQWLYVSQKKKNLKRIA